MNMNAEKLPDVFSSVFGTDLAVVVGLTDEKAYFIEDSPGQVHAFEFPVASDGFTPVGDVSVKHDVFVFASPPGIVTAVQISSRRMLWQKTHRGLISRICIVEASAEIVLCGTTTKVLQIETGERVSSPLSGYHSNVKAGAGCVCVKSRTPDQYYIWHSGKPGLHFQFPATSLKEAFGTPHFFAFATFESAGVVTFVDPTMGTVAARVTIPDCFLIDTFGYDAENDALLVSLHTGTTKRIEIWRLTVMGGSQKIAVLPEGVGTVGWSFRLGGSQLVSRSGRLFDVGAGKLLKNSWAEWQGR